MTESRRAAPTSRRPDLSGRRAALVLGVASSAVWLLTASAFALVTASGRPFPMSVVGLVFPATLPGWLASSVAPWPLAAVLVSALVVGGVAYALAPLATAAGTTRAGTFRRGTLILALWFIVVLAAAATGGLVALGGIAANWPPLRLLELASPVAPAVSTAAYWGLVWGWLPAILAARPLLRQAASANRSSSATWSGSADPAGSASLNGSANPVASATRREPGSPSWLRPVPAALFAVLLVAAFPLAQNANDAAAPAPPAAEPLPEPVIYGSPLVSAAVESGAPESPNPEDEPWCTGGDTAVVLGGGDAATGHRAQELLISNTGEEACLLARYPDVAFDDEGGSAMSVLVFRGGTFMTDDPGLEPVMLQPGASARALLGWNAMATAGDIPVGAVLVAPYAGTDREKLPVLLDIVNGGAVAVTAWQAVDG
ncbi:DUF4232 domain-containing protein [Arthrobacter sulfonylureivorans]|uniref:DUF4232 domain-containing protein n=1 Tax=Arthrobacter sulfonylureivorans TaxID=2486855 RepID=A0ABY3W8N7_9MICC|nr:DUF4232 domain-containing protein [Arthrobacter sulfonylureivorans]UNK46371.1 DUF4232 domain-containing protein [Arthrobacter sulfonylureivorans]